MISSIIKGRKMNSGGNMQLTDEEIRSILKREKLKKRRKQQTRRRLFLILLLIIAIIVAAFIKFRPQPEPLVTEEQPVRGVIFIDPGHGGDDPGSDNGARYEKEDVLKLGLAVRTYLEGKGFEVHMSRISDESVDRELRAQMANECNAQLMVSIHRNKADGKGEGVEAFIPKTDSEESRLLAVNIVKALAEAGFAERTVRAGTLNDPAVDYPEIAATTMPSCLVEVGFISNMDDNKRFDNNLDQNAQAIADAVDNTFRTIYEPGVETDEQAQEEESQAKG